MNPVVRQAYLRELQELQKEAGARAALGLGWAATRAGASRAGSALGKAVKWPMKQLNQAAGTEAHLARSGYKPAVDQAGKATGAWSRPAQGLAAEHEGLQALNTWNPLRTGAGIAQRMGIGLKATGQILAHPVDTVRKGWNAAGIIRRDHTGRLIEEGAGVGLKGLGVAFTAPTVYGAVKPGADPFNPDAGRAERIGRAVGEGAGFIGGQTGGAVAAMTAGMALGHIGGWAGKGVDKSISGIRSLMNAREQEAGATRSPGADNANPVRKANTQRQGLSG